MIQDDKRENELVNLFKLEQDINRKRGDVDAVLNINNKTIKFELKSTTVGNVSTASPLTLEHIQKWKEFHWIIGIYDKKTEKLKHCYYGSPKDMEIWLSSVEENINRGLTLSKMIVKKIDKEMMYAIFGNKDEYTYKEAKYVYGRLFTKKEYLKFMDRKNGYSQDVMLEMFIKHNHHYLIKGSYLNNPKIPKKYYKTWKKINKNHDKILLSLLKNTI